MYILYLTFNNKSTIFIIVTLINQEDIMEQSQWLITAQTLWQLKESIKALQEQEEQLKAQLIALSNDESRIEAPFFFKKEYRNGSIDYSKIEVLKTIDLNLYRKPGIWVWKFDKA